MKQWQCSVCGYIHDGNEPPEKCPVCGADRSQFVELKAEETSAKKPEIQNTAPSIKSKSSENYENITALISKHHLHPISVHIPNGVLPMAVIFMILAVVFQAGGLKMASLYSMIFVSLAMPVVLFSGYIDWQKRYGGNLTHVFLIKMVCGALVASLALLLVVWQIANPSVTGANSSARGVFIFVHLVLLAAAGIAGFLGGKLVFRD